MKQIITLSLTFIYIAAFAQDKPPINWQLLDFKNDGYRGISVEKTYATLLKNKKPKQKIIVAVIDCGVDFAHPDLKNIIWTNKKEIPNNGIDDDRNGYIDDVNGWNFVGNTVGGTTEYIREYVRLRKEFETIKDSTVLSQKKDYAYWKKIVKEKDDYIFKCNDDWEYFQEFVDNYENLIAYYKQRLKKDTITFADLKANPVGKDQDSLLQKNYTARMTFYGKLTDTTGVTLNSKLLEFNAFADDAKKYVDWNNNIINNNDVAFYSKKENITAPDIYNTKIYGNNNVMPSYDNHGTFCAGLIGAVRDNNIGLNGVANNTLIMPIKIIIKTDIDEIDKDIASAIYYATDNGAKVINMSFSKTCSPQKKFIDDAVKYAEKKGVLIFHSAGNNSWNIDVTTKYPTAYFLDKIRATNMIRVGASASDGRGVCDFSNYGKDAVDIFAPGCSYLYSTSLNGSYDGNGEGTSFATPIAAGLAAMLWSYYPNLTYKQIRYCIEQSVTQITELVTKPKTTEKVAFSSFSKTGGVINAYNAFLIADKISKRKKK